MRAVVVGRCGVCEWRDCGGRAQLRVRFVLPSLLAGEVRDYCPRHAGQVSAQAGAGVAGRLQAEAG